MLFLYKIFRQNKMLCRPTVPSFFSELKPETHIYFFLAQAKFHCSPSTDLQPWSVIITQFIERKQVNTC